MGNKDKDKDNESVKVEFKSNSTKTKALINSFITWIISLYVLGFLVVVSGFLSSFIYANFVDKFLELVYSYELSMFMAIISNPLIVLSGATLTIPMLFIYFTLKYLISKWMVFETLKEEKVYMTLAFTLLLLSVSRFF